MSWTEEALEKSLLKIERNMEGIGEHFPHVEYDGIYNDQGASFWTSGFWIRRKKMRMPSGLRDDWREGSMRYWMASYPSIMTLALCGCPQR